MRTNSMIVGLFCVAVSCCGMLQAQETQDESKGSKRAERRAQLLEKFDRNGDGELDNSERQQARKARQELRGSEGRRVRGQHAEGKRAQRQRMLRRQLRQQFDSNEDGQLDTNERQALRQALQARREQHKAQRQQLREQFDTDGNGTLEESEKKSLRAHIRQQRQLRKGERLQRFDKSGDGKLDREERRSMRETLRQDGQGLDRGWRAMRPRHRR